MFVNASKIMNMAELGAALEKSKVNSNINHTHYVQGEPVKKPHKPEFVNISDMVALGKTKPAQVELTSVSVPVPVPVPVAMNDFEKTAGDWVFPVASVAEKNTFLMLCLHLIDAKTSLLRVEDVAKTLEEFKMDLAKNLDNDKNLYKKFGFTRKRTLSIVKMKDEMRAPDTDDVYTCEHFLYLAKLLDAHITLVDLDKIERRDFNDTVGQGHARILFKRGEDGVFQLYTGPLGVAEKLEADLKETPHWSEMSNEKNTRKKKALIKLIGE